VKYYLRRYRSIIMTAVMVAGALFFTSTIITVLDEVMRLKGPRAATENYVPPRASPASHPIISGSRSAFHAAARG
jgi:hypothetical protein